MFSEMRNSIELSQNLLNFHHTLHGSIHCSSVFGQINQEPNVTDTPIVGRGQPGFRWARTPQDKGVVQSRFAIIIPLVQGF